MMAHLHTTSDEPHTATNGTMTLRQRSERRPPARALAVNGRPAGGAGAGVGRQVRPPSNPLLLVHALLRGRYPLAIAAATTLASIGAVVGYSTQTPLYTATGVVSVELQVPKVLYETDENGNMPQYAFAQLVGKQAAMLGSSDIAIAAMDRPEWDEAGWGRGVQARAAFQEALEVTVPRGASSVRVQFTALEPEVAFAGMRSTLEAFEEISGGLREDRQELRIGELTKRQGSLVAEIKADRATKDIISQKYGAADLEPRYQHLIERLTDTDMNLQALALEAANRGIDLDPPPVSETVEPEAPATAPAIGPANESQWNEALTGTEEAELAAPTTAPAIVIPDDQMRILATRNREFAKLLNDRDAARQQIASLALDYGPNSRTMVLATRRMNQLEESTNTWAVFLTNEGLDNAASQYAGETVENLRNQYQKLTALKQRQDDDVRRLGVDYQRIQDYNRKIASDEARLGDIERALTVLNSEKDVGERVEVVDRGAVPAEPSIDKRIPFALAGAAFGAFLGMGLVALRGLFDGKMRWLDDPRNADLLREDRVLAALPDMHGDGGLVAGEDEAVAFQLHKLRLSLQRAARADRRSFAITSPVSGDGKTSVTMALGLSLAASGTRTLLIDFDLVGKSLSRRFARKAAPGETQVPDRGLGAILRGSSVTECFQETDVKRLSLLGCADAGSEDARRLSPRFARHVLKEALEHYEMVLIDTGPLLASLEANTIAAETDGAVLCVSRGTDRELVKRSVDLLGEKCRNFEGIVINRLDAQQFDKYVSSTMSMSVPNDPTASWRSASAKPNGGSGGANIPTLVTRTAPGAKPRLAPDSEPDASTNGKH